MRKAGHMDLEAYGQAIIHLAWHRNDKNCSLLFGMLELRPKELPLAIGCRMKKLRIGNKGRKYVHYRRYAVGVGDANEWYEAAVHGSLEFPKDVQDHVSGPNETEPGPHLDGGPFLEEPCWPSVVTSNSLIFAPDWMHGSRAHFLFPKATLDSEILNSIKKEKVRRKLEEWLNFDLVLTYSDYLGAMVWVAPNPVFRSIEKSHIEQPPPGSRESVAYKVVARAGQCVNGLRLEVINERLRGRMAPLVHEFGNETIVEFDLPAEIYKEGQSVTHPLHGLLSWHEPLPLLRKLHVGFELQRRRKRVSVPAGGKSRPEYEYDVDEMQRGGKTTFGEAFDDEDVILRLLETEHQRSRRHATGVQEQVWFNDAAADAAEFVRSKLGRARDTVLIVDPYFCHTGLMAFGHAVRRPDVDIRILTSAEVLRQEANSDANLEEGKILKKALDETFDEHSANPEIRVLRGNPPPIHDRFLVIDGEVWLSGNSLETLGERAGMIVKLPDPDPVIAKLEAYWNKSSELSDWLSRRTAKSSKT